MSDDWIYRRFERFKAARKAEELRQQWQANALAALPSMLHQLKERIEKDVSEYNGFFSSYMDAGLRSDPQGTTRASLTTASERLEIAPDEQGAIRYRFHDAFLKDVVEASEKVLDTILC